MRVAIHQPDFFPWLGLFNKVAFAEKFVVLDHVIAPQGKSWLTRNRILLNGNPIWLTLPIVRGGKSQIKDVEINYGVRFQRKHLGTLKQAYHRADCFEDVYSLVGRIYNKNYTYAADLSFDAIAQVSAYMEIGPEFVFSSDLVVKEPELATLKGNELILELCKAAGATSYLSGTGCLDFIKPSTFEDEGIEFWFQGYESPDYPQQGVGTPVRNLSTLDAVFNVGFERARELVVRDCRLYPSDIVGEPK